MTNSQLFDEIYSRFSLMSPARRGWVVATIVLILIVPWLGLTEFNTKGEPREAVVSMSMIQSGNWVLPSNNDVDIPYKPVLFHWLGAVAAEINGGEVNEFTSRLPSALAFALLIGSTCWFFSKYDMRHRLSTTLLTCGILIGCFELHRAGTNARVDMLLTALMVFALYQYYAWGVSASADDKFRIPKASRVPWLAILAMSGATLAKGPVGILLPSLIIGLYLLLRGANFISAFWRISLYALLALIIPMCWYYAAWKIGGDNFLGLVLEENLGRMTGTMTYESHANPWHYNLWITAAGLMPWSLLGLLALPSGVKALLRNRDKLLKNRLLNDVNLYSLIALAMVMIFFTIPQSKRSVYLMPAYPFIAWFMAVWFISLARKGKRLSISIFGWFLAIVGILLEVALIAVSFLPAGVIEFSGRHATENMAMLDSLSHPSWLCWLTVGLVFTISVAWIVGKLWRKNGVEMLVWESVMIISLFLAFDAGLQPTILNVKSLKQEAMEVDKLIADSKLDIYEYITLGENEPANRYHFFELDFYLGDRMKNFSKHKPQEGYLAIIPEELTTWLSIYEEDGYSATPVYLIAPPGRKEKVAIARISR